MDNRVFNVNGRGYEMLERALKLVFMQTSSKETAVGHLWDRTKGLILFSIMPSRAQIVHGSGNLISEQIVNKFMVPLSASAVAPMVAEWLKSDQAKETVLDGWDANADHDGHNTLGWRVYCEDWGKVGDYVHTICAIKPAHMWHGK